MSKLRRNFWSFWSTPRRRVQKVGIRQPRQQAGLVTRGVTTNAILSLCARLLCGSPASPSLRNLTPSLHLLHHALSRVQAKALKRLSGSVSYEVLVFSPAVRRGCCWWLACMSERAAMLAATAMLPATATFCCSAHLTNTCIRQCDQIWIFH